MPSCSTNPASVLAESPSANEVAPYELLSWKNDTGSSKVVRLVVNRYAGATPRVKFALLQNGGGVTSTEYEESSPGPEGDVVGPTIYGHNGGEDTISVGAIRYSSNTAPETYTSRGPVTHYFGRVEGTVPASALGPPQVLAKPDLTATDCGATSFFAFESAGKWRFCGTSAAAPHAAGVAALMLQRNPAAAPSLIRSALADSAQPVGVFGANAVGAGLVDAVGALEGVPADEEGEGSQEEGWDVPEERTVHPSPIAPEGITTPVSPETSADTTRSTTPPPSTFFRHHPRGVARTRGRTSRAVFVFGSDQGAVTFLCKVDRGRFHRCKAWFVRRYRLGRHVLRVKARRNSDGAADGTPAVYRFRVKRVWRGVIKRRHRRHRHRG